MDLACEKNNYTDKEEISQRNDPPRKGFEGLPRDIIIDILSRLPINSLLQIRLLCRSLNLLSRDQNLAFLHISRTSHHNPHLIFHTDYPIKNELRIIELSKHLETERVIKINTPFHDLMPEFDIIASCNGLLCLIDTLHHERLVIYNPFMKIYKELPKSREYDDHEDIVGFGFSPKTKEYKVVKLVVYWNQYDRHRPTREGARSEIQIFSIGKDDNWRYIGDVPYNLNSRDSRPVWFNGRLHILTQPIMHRENGRFSSSHRNIISFDLENENFEEVPRPGCGGLNHLNYHLVILGGYFSAMLFIYQENRMEIWVMKEYNVKESWSKQYSFPDYSKQFLRPEMRPYMIWRNVVNKRSPRVICLLENGDVLIEYKGGVLVSHDPESGAFKKLIIRGVPDLVHTVVHTGSITFPCDY